MRMKAVIQLLSLLVKIVLIYTFQLVGPGLASNPMMRPGAPMAQVRGANFLGEILDGISNLQLVLYRTGCHERRGVLHLRSRCK